MLHHPLHQAILADPESAEPRLIYADWMDECNDPRGEFIRLQLQIAEQLRSASVADVAHLIDKAEKLKTRHHSPWNRPLHRFLSEQRIRVKSRRGDVRRWHYRRGFVEIVELALDVLVSHWSSISMLGPIDAVVLHGPIEKTLQGWQRPEQIRHVAIRNYSASDIVLLSSTNLFDHLAILELRNCYLIPEAAEILMQLKREGKINNVVIKGGPYWLGQQPFMRPSAAQQLILESPSDDNVLLGGLEALGKLTPTAPIQEPVSQPRSWWSRWLGGR